jgi:hypothetical protein
MTRPKIAALGKELLTKLLEDWPIDSSTKFDSQVAEAFEVSNSVLKQRRRSILDWILGILDIIAPGAIILLAVLVVRDTPIVAVHGWATTIPATLFGGLLGFGALKLDRYDKGQIKSLVLSSAAAVVLAIWVEQLSPFLAYSIFIALIIGLVTWISLILGNSDRQSKNGKGGDVSHHGQTPCFEFRSSGPLCRVQPSGRSSQEPSLSEISRSVKIRDGLNSS